MRSFVNGSDVAGIKKGRSDRLSPRGCAFRTKGSYNQPKFA